MSTEYLYAPTKVEQETLDFSPGIFANFLRIAEMIKDIVKKE